MGDNDVISIDEAINYCHEVYERDDMSRECRDGHVQLAKWLEELKKSRERINRLNRVVNIVTEERDILAKMHTDNLYERIKSVKKAKSKAVEDFCENFMDAINSISFECGVSDHFGEMYTQSVVNVSDIANLLKSRLLIYKNMQDGEMEYKSIWN